MTKLLSFFKSIPRPFALAALSGIFVGTSYIPFPGWALLFCYSPLWLAVSAFQENTRPVSYKKIFLLGWISQFILTLIGFNWIYYVASEFGLLHWSLSLGALLLFAAFMHLYIPLSLVLAARIAAKFQITSKLSQFLLMALTLSFLERVWPSIFEWNLGYSLLWMKWPLYQWADVVGFWGLSTWILIAQAFVTYGISQWPFRRKQTVQSIGATVAVLALLTTVGLAKQKKWSHFDQSVQFGVVQGNIGNADKIASEQQQNYQSFILQLYAKLTDQLLQKNPDTEIMLWPETAMPFPLDPYFLGRSEQRQLLNLLLGWNRPLITGGYSVDTTQKDHLGNSLISNAVFFMGPQNPTLAKAYDKTDLLVFGEYMPFGRQLPLLYKLLPFVGNYKIGLGPTVREIPLSLKKLKIGPQICYESLNPSFSRGLAEKGAQILFNVTNDSWFGWWAEPFQHQIMTLGRAIEVRRPLVRSTNTGITSVILANGDRLEDSPIAESWTHAYKVSYLENPPQTLYTRFGHYDWLLWIVVLCALIFFSRSQEKKGKYVSN